jgi:PAS domain S-box-containing protein
MTTTTQSRPSADPSSAATWLPAGILVLSIFLLAAWAVREDFQLHRARAGARLEAIAELRASQVDGWIDHRMRIAHFLDDSAGMASLFTRWRDSSDAAAGQALLQRAIDARQAGEGVSALIVDAEGNILASEHPQDEEASPEMKATVREAIAGRGALNSGIYRSADPSLSLRMDVVIPLLKSGRPARGALVMRVDPRTSLFGMLNPTPIQPTTAESLLWRQLGPRIINVSEVHQNVDSSGRVDQAVATSSLPIAQVIRGERPPDVVASAVDGRGEPVLSVTRRVPGTDWWVESKINVAEVDAPVWVDAAFIVLAALSATLGSVIVLRRSARRRSAAEQARQLAEQRERLQTLSLLEAIAESATDAIYAKDLEGRYIFYNRAAGAQIGLQPHEVIGRTNEELFDADTAAKLRLNDGEAMLRRVSLTFEESIPTPQGSRTVLSSKGPLLDPEGGVIGMLGVSRDISERRHTERLLRDGEAHYRSTVSALNEGIFVCDPQGRIISCNPAAEQILRVSIDEWRGRWPLAPHWIAIRADGSPMPPDETPCLRVLAGEGPQLRVPLRAISPSGELVLFEVSALPVISPDTGLLMSVVSSFTDVTERERLSEELKRHRDQLEELVVERTAELTASNDSLARAAQFNRDISDAIPGLVTVWDADLRCRFANQGYLEWAQKTQTQVLGKTRAEIFGTGPAAQVDARMRAAIEGRAQRFEHETWRDGKLRSVHLVQFLPAREIAGERGGVYAMAFDVTALKRSEADLQRANEALRASRDEAERATRSKSTFLAEMSHEIRTPMNAIIGLTHLMTRDTLVPRQRDRASKIGGAARHLLQVINDILDLSKIEAGKLVLHDADFSLAQVLRQTTQMVQTRAREKGLALIVECTDLPDRLRGDATRVSQVLLNLLANAINFTDHGHVRLSGQALAEGDHRVSLRFEVEDTGPGISPEMQQRLFTTFEQGDRELSRERGGTGLGLALSRQLAVAMGGGVGVVSEPGRGSVFWFTASFRQGSADAAPAAVAPDDDTTVTAPAHDPADGLQISGPLPAATLLDRLVSGRRPAHKAAVAEPADDLRLEALLRDRHAGQRVLLAEDNPVNREVAEEMLRSVGLVVESAPNGVRAVELARSRAYDLILMDLQMPLMGGLQAARVIREQADRATPIVAMTANAFLEDRAACLDAGMNDHVTKPVDPALMYATLLRWLAVPPDAPALDAATEPPFSVEVVSTLWLRERLADIDGFDIDMGLRNMRGQLDVLARVLARFVETYRAGVPALLVTEGNEAERSRRMRAVCHSLGGASAAIGAAWLMRDLAELAQALRDGTPTERLAPQAQQLNDNLIRFVARLGAELMHKV